MSLVFDIPINGPTGLIGIYILGYWDLPAGKSFNCETYAYDGHGPYVVGDSGPNYFTAGGQFIYEVVNQPIIGGTVQLICWNVPPGAGIA